MTIQQERWKGRNTKKDELRSRVWQQLQDTRAAVGNPWSTIPDYVGAELAAEQLTKLDAWQQARIVKCNPDRAQAWVRLKALEQGKCVYTPIPELVKEFPFLFLDPSKLEQEGIDFKNVMYSEGALQYGEKVDFEDMQVMDICVVGCVAVTESGGRTGKGAGFADLEMGIFRELGILSPGTPVVTTVHNIQVVAQDSIVMESHDAPLNWIATPDRLIQTHTQYPVPGAMDWTALRTDQFEKIPFLSELRQRMQG